MRESPISINYQLIRDLSTRVFRVSNMFMILFNMVYFLTIPLRGLTLGLLDPIAGFFDILTGIGIIAFFSFLFYASKSRFGALFVIIGFAFWWLVPCNWIISEYWSMYNDFLPTYYIMWTNMIILGLITILGLLIFLLDSIILLRNRKSLIWGPWFARFTILPKIGRISIIQKSELKKGVLFFCLVMAIFIPGILPFFDVYTLEVEITPKDYDITYNFWATPDINGTYTTYYQEYLGVGEYYYNSSVLAELNEHKVNLDLTFNRLYPEDILMLKEWEKACPDITYRITIYPSELSELPILVYNATELLMEAENNGTLDQWIGFTFDIEGTPYWYNSSFDSFEEALGMWNTVFDYIDTKSAVRGKTIEMECVSDPWLSVDYPFDGDADIHKERQQIEYVPERFTSYAPMIYRCWYDDRKELEPYGGLMDPSDPWPTTYSFYSSLYTLAAGIPKEKVGAYIGLTNGTCYNRDWPQYEPYTWPEDVPNTGYYNLMRDVLVCKHFEVKEVTFFLLWTVIENNMSMGGVFDTYGMDFLDVVNTTVNTNPPEKFDIFYKNSDATLSTNLRYDWVYDFSHPYGPLQIIFLWALAVGFEMLLSKKPSQKKENKIEQIESEKVELDEMK